jgi:hypothetical protein
MIVSYERNRKLVWTEEARVSFHKIKQIINDIPTLFFPVEGGTIFLCTDASDYGIGSYCYQTVDDRVYHIAFVSKLLSAQETRWSTIEKEAYAIVYSLKKLEYLLRDKPFILKTDHLNLTFIDRESNAKVKRWKLDIQEYDFEIEYIPGPKNVVADGLSRLLDVREEQICLLDTFILSPDIYDEISKVHDEKVGHVGVELTLERLRKKMKHWPYMRHHVKRFIKQCPCCPKDELSKDSHLHSPLYCSLL